MGKEGSMNPIIIIVAPMILALVSFFASKMKKAPEDILLGVYGLTEVLVKIFGVLVYILR
jgi:hypothetical protein